LSVIHQKEKKVLGEANLDLSLYGEDEVKILKLPLLKCADPDAYIEVGMKAYEADDKAAKARRTSDKKPKEDANAVQGLMYDESLPD
jgi:hypothetical protein